MNSLVGAHGCARFLHGNGHALALEHLDEHDGRRDAAEVHGGAGPVQQDGLQLAAVGALITECHLSLPLFELIASRFPPRESGGDKIGEIRLCASWMPASRSSRPSPASSP